MLRASVFTWGQSCEESECCVCVFNYMCAHGHVVLHVFSGR